MQNTGKQNEGSRQISLFHYAGAFIAFMCGSGFATGQEVMQYYVAYGLKGIAAILTVFILLTYTGIRLVSAGYQQRFAHNSDIFSYYCGFRIGCFFDCFIIFSIYMSFVVILAGAGATMAQQFHLPTLIGIVDVYKRQKEKYLGW